MQFEIKKILYATDLGPHGPDVFRCAVSLAEKYAASLYLLHVVEDPAILKNNVADRYISGSVLDTYRESVFEEAIETMRSRLEAFGQSALESENAEHAHVHEIKVLSGNPARTILAEADRIDADCIVMGSRRYSGMSDVLLGSVARKVTRRSLRPVFLFPV
jgi:nucleotide-binding universal stress UspA family protein